MCIARRLMKFVFSSALNDAVHKLHACVRFLLTRFEFKRNQSDQSRCRSFGSPILKVVIAIEPFDLAGRPEQFKADVSAALVAERQGCSANNGDQMWETVLIMRNAIETIGGSRLSRLEYLRHKGAHQSAELDLAQHRGDRTHECH
jgi:hypothetical protein